MPIVAVAGGTGGLGRAIVEAIVAAGKHQVVILSRKTFSDPEAKFGAQVLAINYSSVEDIVAVLEQNNIDTVISTLNGMSGESLDVNLIRAAEKSKSTKRFLPSVWGIPYTEKHVEILPQSQAKVDSMAELSKTLTLEYTSVYNGYFLDYFGVPNIKTYLSPLTIVIDMQNNFAAVPGDGNTPVVFTYTMDVARYVAAILDLPKWEKASWIIGDKVTWNEFVKLAEAAKGTEFQVTYDPVELLKSGKVTELPSHKYVYQFVPKEHLQGLFSVFEQWFEDGTFDFKPDVKTLNELFPEIKAATVKDLLNQAWKGK